MAELTDVGIFALKWDKCMPTVSTVKIEEAILKSFAAHRVY